MRVLTYLKEFMDSSEQIANKYLIHIGANSLEFEPDGSVPPDFTIEKRIAIEVRRLNRNYELPNGSNEGFEETSIPLVQTCYRRSQARC